MEKTQKLPQDAQIKRLREMADRLGSTDSIEVLNAAFALEALEKHHVEVCRKASREVAELEAERDELQRKLDHIVEMYNRNRRDANGCCCLFEEDGETPAKRCSVHAAIEDERDALQKKVAFLRHGHDDCLGFLDAHGWDWDRWRKDNGYIDGEGNKAPPNDRGYPEDFDRED